VLKLQIQKILHSGFCIPNSTQTACPDESGMFANAWTEVAVGRLRMPARVRGH